MPKAIGGRKSYSYGSGGNGWLGTAHRVGSHFIKHRREYKAIAQKAKKFLTGGRKVPYPPLSSKHKKKVRKIEAPVSEVAQHSGLTTDTIKVSAGHKIPKNIKSLGRWKIWQTGAGVFGSVAGQQQVVMIAACNTISQHLTTTGSTYAYDQAATSMFDMNPYLKTTGSGYLPPGVVSQNDQLIVLNNNIYFEMTNFSTVGAIIDLYLITPKKLTGRTPDTDWQGGYQVEGGGILTPMTHPGPGWTSGSGVVPAPVSGYPLASMVNMKPGQSSLFKEFWKVVAVKHITMTGSSTEILTWDISIQKHAKKEYLNTQAANGIRYLPGVTYFVMAVVRGSLVLDETNANHVPTYGSTKVGYIYQQGTKCCAVQGNAGRLNVTTAIEEYPTGTLVGNQKVLNEVDAPTDAGTGTVP